MQAQGFPPPTPKHFIIIFLPKLMFLLFDCFSCFDLKIIISALQSSQDCSVPEHPSNLTKQPGNAFSLHEAAVFLATSDFRVRNLQDVAVQHSR